MLHSSNTTGMSPLLPRQYGRRALHLALVALFALVSTLTISNSSTMKAHADTLNGPALSVNATADRHAISRDIYGLNTYGVDPAFAKELHIPVQRWGGDATTRYNWLVDSSNSGGDWYFMGGNGTSNPTPGASADNFVNTNNSVGSKSLLTIPVIDYINKTSEWNCSYPKSLYPNQQSYNPYITLANGDQCGNGVDTSGNNITDTNIGLNNIPNSASFQQKWVQHLVDTHGIAGHGGVNIYQMDNEPSGWGNTHRDIHPQPTGYDELINKTLPYAVMIKRTDPHAAVLGPSDFGYPAYIGMGAPGDDANSHGVGFAEYYLQQMNALSQKYHTRLLDYFDEHYYPSSGDTCIANCPAGDANTQAERLQSTRTLWDPTYKDTSWIGTWFPPIQLIPWFHSMVDKDYPGTKIAITEYNFGGLEAMNGALTEADVLGIFGRERLDLATLWGPPSADQPGAYAFRMYLNYDGNGSAYGDTWVQSQSADQGQLAIYGAQRSSDGALTLVIINKTANDLTSSLTLSNYTPAANAQVYTYSGTNLSAIVRQPDQPVTASGFTRTYPANSISTIVLSPASAPATLQGVSHNSNTGTYNTYAGSLNPNNSTANVPAGNSDRFTSTSADRNQPTTFQSRRQQ